MEQGTWGENYSLGGTTKGQKEEKSKIPHAYLLMNTEIQDWSSLEETTELFYSKFIIGSSSKLFHMHINLFCS